MERERDLNDDLMEGVRRVANRDRDRRSTDTIALRSVQRQIQRERDEAFRNAVRKGLEWQDAQ